MRWALGVGGLVAVAAVLRSLGPDGSLEGRATLALGFLLLAAQLAAELSARARLPRLTGALVAGVVAGPAWLAPVRGDEVRALAFLADAALALVALSAGTRLSLPALRGERGLARLVAATILGAFTVVAGVVWSVTPWLPPTRHKSVGDGLAFALVLGGVAAAAAPAVVGALLDELGRRGATARRLVALNTAHALAAVALVALVLLLARPIAGRGAIDPGVAVATLTRLAGSLGLGAALGLVVARAGGGGHVGRPAWVPIVLALITAEASRVLGLEPTLVALATGCALGSTVGDRAWGDALAPSAGVAALAYFALTGAALDLAALSAFWPWVILFAGVRVVGLRAGARWAGRSPVVTGDLARLGWLGVISQGGVALGLAGAARRAFPEWGVSFEALIVALVAVHLAAGPIVLRRVLAGSVSTTEDQDGVEHRGASGGVAVAPGPRRGV